MHFPLSIGDCLWMPTVQVLAMEEHLLGVLRFELTVPTAKTFLRRFVQAAMHGGEPDLRLEHLASYLTELALLEYGVPLSMSPLEHGIRDR